MPIATKLSRRLQEVFGTEAADAMVDWMHEMEGGRAELRELNDLSFARFDSRLGERIAQLEVKTDRRIATLDAKIDRVAAELNAKIDHVAAELNAKIDHVAAELNAKIDHVDVKIDRVAADLGARMDVGFARIEATAAQQRAELMRWTATFWVGSLVAMASAVIAAVRLAR